MFIAGRQVGASAFSPRGAACVEAESGKTGKRGSEGVGGVGVGSPNPSGEETSPLRLGLFFAPVERYVYRRAVCPKPCAPEEHYVPICLNQDSQD